LSERMWTGTPRWQNNGVRQSCQTFPGKFIDHIQDPKRSSIVCSFEHKVIAPDMVRVFRLQPQIGPIVQPQATPFGLSGRHFQLFLAPNSLHALVVHLPPLVVQEGSDASISIASILAPRATPGSLPRLFGASGIVVSSALVQEPSRTFVQKAETPSVQPAPPACICPGLEVSLDRLFQDGIVQ
jgi:hypothetical protein